VLRPRGRLLILDTDWDSIVWHSSDPARMQRVLAAWDDHLADPHLPRRLGRLLVGAGFTVTHVGVLPLLNTDYGEDVYSHGLIDFVTGFVPGRGGVTDDDVRAWADDLRGLGPTTSSASTATSSSPRAEPRTAAATGNGVFHAMSCRYRRSAQPAHRCGARRTP
jgi:hypothetical protein